MIDFFVCAFECLCQLHPTWIGAAMLVVVTEVNDSYVDVRDKISPFAGDMKIGRVGRRS